MDEFGVVVEDGEQSGSGSAGEAYAVFPFDEGGEAAAQGCCKLRLGETLAAAQLDDAGGCVCFHGGEV